MIALFKMKVSGSLSTNFSILEIKCSQELEFSLTLSGLGDFGLPLPGGGVESAPL